MSMAYRDPDVEKAVTPGGRAASTVHIRYRIDPGLGLTEDELAPDLSRIGLAWTPILHPDDPLAPRR